MSWKTIVIVLLAAIFSMNMDAKDKAKKASVTRADSISEFSYNMGVAQVSGLMQYLSQRLGIDTLKNKADFQRGVAEMFKKSDDKKLAAYSAGLQVGQQMSQQFVGQINQQITGEQGEKFLDEEAFKQGFMAAITGKGLTTSLADATKSASESMTYYKDQLMEKKYGDNRKAGEEWLAENAKKEGVKTLPSGVQYKVLVEGKGEKPKATSTVKVNYEGKLIDGTEFDSSYKRKKPSTFKCNQVIKGWTEALQQMPVGSTWEIYIPQELAYGKREAGRLIKPYSALTFKVELLEIVPETKEEKK